MRRSAQSAGKQAKLWNEACKEPNADKDRSKDKTSKIATLDNGTMVEVFKYLNYCQLAKNSLVSKRYCDLIQTHRYSLALLYVDRISMHSNPINPTAIKIFDKRLTSEAYNEWVIRNGYSKHAPLHDQVATTQSSQNIPSVYMFFAYANYKDPRHRKGDDRTIVFSARVEFNDDNWPVFQHFVRLATDPFIYIDRIYLAYQIDALNLLSGTINSDNDRLQCKELSFNLNGNNLKSITWPKDHVHCNQFSISGETELNHDEAFLDFFLTGAHCTSEVKVHYNDLSKVIVDFVQNFIDFKHSDGSQLVEAIEGSFKGQAMELLKRYYAEFIVKEERGHRYDSHIFEFVNADIGKKLQLTTKTYGSLMSTFLIKINNL